MPRLKSHKQQDNRGRRKQQKELADMIIHGLDQLAAQAEAMDMGTACRILYTAKEEMVHWSVTMNFHETPQDRFINRRLYDSRSSIIEALLIRAMRNSGKGAKRLGTQPANMFLLRK